MRQKTLLKIIGLMRKNLDKGLTILEISKQLKIGYRPAYNHITEMEKEGIRVDIDDEPQTLSKKILKSEEEWVPYTLVIGDKEANSKKFNVRIREEAKQKELLLDTLIKNIQKDG